MAELVVACGSGLRAAALSVGGTTNYLPVMMTSTDDGRTPSLDGVDGTPPSLLVIITILLLMVGSATSYFSAGDNS